MATSLFSSYIATIPLSPSSLHPTLLPPLSHPHDFIRFRHHRRRQIPSFAASFPPHQVSPIVNAIDNDQSPQRTSTDSEDEIDNLGVRAALSMLRFYKREISPLLPSSCRYVPTCSEYSMISYKKYGVVKGTILTAWRICRCNPLGGSGFDPPRWFGEGDPLDD